MPQRRGDRWRVQARDPVTGRVVSRTFESKVEAEAEESRLRHARRELRHGHRTRAEVARLFENADKRPCTVADLWSVYAEKVGPSSARRVLEPARKRLVALGVLDRPPEALDSVALASIVAKLREQYAANTVRSTVRCLTAAVRLAIPKLLAAPPWGGRILLPVADDETREACRTMAELELLAERAVEFDEARMAADPPRFSDAFARIVVLSLTGMRTAEAAALRWGDVRIDAMPWLIRIDRQVVGSTKRAERKGRVRELGEAVFGPTKTRRARVLALHPAAVAALREQRRALELFGLELHDDSPVFPRPGGGFRLTGRAVSSSLVRLLVRRAGFSSPARWTAHSLRHTFATLEAQASGGDLRAVSARTGHRSLAALSGYLHGTRELAPALAPPSARLVALAGDQSLTTETAAANVELRADLGEPERPAVEVRAKRAADRARARAIRTGKTEAEALRAAGRARAAVRARAARPPPVTVEAPPGHLLPV
jgi:integrase